MLYSDGHRYYDPETGGYLRRDPIGLAGGMNPYGYAGSNPLAVIDPLGLEPMQPYENLMEAVKAAAQENWELTKENGVEYSGGIYEGYYPDPDNVGGYKPCYSYFKGLKGDKVSSPMPKNHDKDYYKETYHTHPEPEESDLRELAMFFSTYDVERFNEHGKPLYLFAPDGSIWKIAGTEHYKKNNQKVIDVINEIRKKYRVLGKGASDATQKRRALEENLFEIMRDKLNALQDDKGNSLIRITQEKPPGPHMVPSPVSTGECIPGSISKDAQTVLLRTVGQCG